MQIVLAIVILGMYVGISYYLGWGLKRWLQALDVFKWPKLYWIVFFIIAFSPMIGMGIPFLSFMRTVGNYWMFFFQYGLLIYLVIQIVMLVPKLRNLKLLGMIGAILFVGLFIAGTYFAYSPVVREMTIEIDKEGEPMRIVMASDFHLGVLSNKEHLARFVKLSNEAKPDLVLLSGDIIDDDPKWYTEDQMADVMRELEATYGVYGALGNHEYYGNKLDEILAEMEKSNVEMLLDETIVINDAFYLTGREDYANDNRLPLADLRPEDDSKPWIVINHTPHDLLEQAKKQVDLMVFGHTHKGQLWPNEWITSFIYDLDYGHQKFEQMHAVVSSGFGFWGPPMRIGSRAELWVIDVQFKDVR